MGNHSPSHDTWNLDAALQRISHWLPTQGPIKDFIHHNTLHAFQNLEFHEGIGVASHLFGAKRYLPLAWYQKAYRAGHISDSALERIAQQEKVSDVLLWKNGLLSATEDSEAPPGIAASGLRAQRKFRTGFDAEAQVQPVLFRLLAAYLDQGVSIWRMPKATESFWSAVGNLARENSLPLDCLSDPECRDLFAGSAEAAIETALKYLVGNPAYHEQYLLELCLSHPGWSGMVGILEQNNAAVIAQRPVKQVDVIAVELLLELSAWRQRLGKQMAPEVKAGDVGPVDPAHLRAPLTPALQTLKAWHEAFEWTLYEHLFALLEMPERAQPASLPPARVQAIFCIDDRECSVRRHIESIDPSYRTFATAGFFGIDFLFQPADSAHAFQFCPVVLKPQHLVKQTPKTVIASPTPSWRDLFHLPHHSNTLFRGWLLTQTVGLFSLFKLALEIFRPSSRLLVPATLNQVDQPTDFALLREADSKTPEGLYLGYSFDEMADRVYRVFAGMGLKEGFCKLIIFIAHGSSSANNPHFAAYDCGACSGKPGAPNARSIAWMANHPEVRQRLEAKGMVLEDDVLILGALHDTTKDQIDYFDTLNLGPVHRQLFDEFKEKVEQALDKNAIERCRLFELAPEKLTGPQARQHVLNRAQSIFEPRPELNHATNAFAIVGRRSLTQGLFLNRRAFLNSYDPFQDASGQVLQGILGAVVPVCGGINLEYFFSRVDNEVYGAGTKLPHNVFSLLGIANGVEGDLRTGLPSQMIEVHDPIRLLILVEQEPELVLEVAKRNPAIFEWIENGWVRLAAHSPTKHESYLYEAGKMNRVQVVPGFTTPGIPNPTSETIAEEGRP